VTIGLAEKKKKRIIFFYEIVSLPNSGDKKLYATES
jgi:hypothetical protein